MKNLIVSIAVMLTTGLAPVLANRTDNDPRAEKIFEKQFAGARHVKWTRLDDGFLRVSFVLNGIGAETFFDGNGEILGTVRNLFYSQLPLSVIQKIGSKFPEGVIIDVKEITTNNGTSYKVILEEKNKKYKLRLSSFGNITEMQKDKIKK